MKKGAGTLVDFVKDFVRFMLTVSLAVAVTAGAIGMIAGASYLLAVFLKTL